MYIVIKICFFVFLCQGFKQVFGKRCNGEEIGKHLLEVYNYETLKFPLYGKSEAQLDETCLKLNSTLENLMNYTSHCQHDPNCDEECRVNIYIAQHTGLTTLAEELCRADERFRELYLVYASCLQSLSNEYNKCHNISERTKDLLMNHTIVDRKMKCCYISWYKSCFMEATLRGCGYNASRVVSMVLHHLIAHFESICENEPPCLKPPLPEDEVPEDEGPEIQKVDITGSSSKGQSEKDPSYPEDPTETYIPNGRIKVLHFSSIYAVYSYPKQEHSHN